MGEYAQDYIDSSFGDHYDRVQGCGIYSDNSIIDEWDVDDDPEPVFSLPSYNTWKVREILAETDKSRLIISDKTGNKFWVSKRLSILKGGLIFIQRWYACKLSPLDTPASSFDQLCLNFDNK